MSIGTECKALGRHSVRTVAGSNTAGDIFFFILNFRSFSVPHNSAKPIQMKSSMAFIQSNGCMKTKIIFKKMEAQYNVS